MKQPIPQPEENPKVKNLRDWNGFAFGDMVKVAGERGIFKFMGHCTHLATGNEWVALYGGDKDPTGHRMFRYVDPGRVKRIPKKRGSEQ